MQRISILHIASNLEAELGCQKCILGSHVIYASMVQNSKHKKILTTYMVTHSFAVGVVDVKTCNVLVNRTKGITLKLPHSTTVYLKCHLSLLFSNAPIFVKKDVTKIFFICSTEIPHIRFCHRSS